jgi:tRNA threonylcarbamoyladenosine biosynthesis protein TsaE
MTTLPIIEQLKQGIVSHCVTETQAVAKAFAHALPPDSVLALHGDLGTGKTTFVAGLAQAWGITQSITSPTFTLLNSYTGPDGTLLHLDAYRLEHPEALEALCLEDCLVSPFYLTIEWPEKIAAAIPPHALHLYFNCTQAGMHTIRLGS